MKKDWLTITPDTGSGNATVSASVSENSSYARSLKIFIESSGMKRTVSISQKQGLHYVISVGNKGEIVKEKVTR